MLDFDTVLIDYPNIADIAFDGSLCDECDDQNPYCIFCHQDHEEDSQEAAEPEFEIA